MLRQGLKAAQSRRSFASRSGRRLRRQPRRTRPTAAFLGHQRRLAASVKLVGRGVGRVAGRPCLWPSSPCAQSQRQLPRGAVAADTVSARHGFARDGVAGRACPAEGGTIGGATARGGD